MGKSLKCILYFLLALLSSSCQSPTTQFDESKYVAHLKLESTTLMVTELVDSLEVPWDMAMGPEGWIWFTEQKGTIKRVHTETGELQELAKINDLFYRKSTGLLSMVLHPDFESHPYAYIHYTYAEKDSNLLDKVSSRIVRLSWRDHKLEEPTTLLDAIPGNTFHNGSRMLIADGKLWLGTGDAGSTDSTQDPKTNNGKVLRLELDGSIPLDNPDPNSPVWSVGHRNIQGITYVNGKIFTSEHGPNNDDEINLIEKAANYGWPDVEGFCDLDREKKYCEDHSVIEPLYAWTPTIAPSGLTYYGHDAIPEWKNSLLLGTLKGQSLRVLHLDRTATHIEKQQIFFQQTIGRIRDVAVSTNGTIFLCTSNLDWHPGHQPWMYDKLPTKKSDRILKIEPMSSPVKSKLAKLKKPMELHEDVKAFDLPTENWDFAASDGELHNGQQLYLKHCATCHLPNGEGNIGQIPPLVNSEWVSGNTGRLIDVVLLGLNMPIKVNGISYEGEMPSYKNLGDGEIMDILNYIRVTFGETKGNIIAADVNHQRKGLK